MPETITQETSVQTLEIRREQRAEAPIDIVFEAMLEALGPKAKMPDDKPLSLKLEAWPGGRWYRDLGNNAGHLWGHVQVIKPPALLEICGPMPMAYPAVNHLQYRLTPDGQGTRISFVHRAIGLIPKEHRDGMQEGWELWLKQIRELAESRKGAPPKSR